MQGDSPNVGGPWFLVGDETMVGMESWGDVLGLGCDALYFAPTGGP